MKINEVKALTEILCTHGLTAIEVGAGENRIRIEKEAPALLPALASAYAPASVAALAAAVPAEAVPAGGALAAAVPAGGALAAATPTPAVPTSAVPAPAVPNSPTLTQNQASNNALDFSHLVEVTSPLVGVYYSAPSPDSETFVSIGSKVKKGDVLCIIETMKLMNEITAEQDGEIVDICIKNGDIAEFGQLLFKMF